MDIEEQKETLQFSSYFSLGISVILLGALALLSLAFSERALSAFALLAFGLMLVLRIWGRLAPVRLEVVIRPEADRLFPGETLKIDAEIRNRKPLPVWMRIELPDLGTFERLTDSGLDGEAALMPFAVEKGSWSFRAAARGVFDIGKAKLQAGDNLGVFRSEKRLRIDREIIVYPRKIHLSAADFPFRHYFGIHPTKGIVEDPAWYEGTREYTGTKSAKHIHWKASARLGELQEKVFQPTSHQKIFLILDAHGYLERQDSAGFERALELAGSIARIISESGASFGAAVNCEVLKFPHVLPLGRGPEHLGSCLELLARAKLAEGESAASALSRFGGQGAGFVVIARSPDERSAAFSRLPSSKRDRVVFIFAKGSGQPASDALTGAVVRSFADFGIEEAPSVGAEAVI